MGDQVPYLRESLAVKEPIIPDRPTENVPDTRNMTPPPHVRDRGTGAAALQDDYPESCVPDKDSTSVLMGPGKADTV